MNKDYQRKYLASLLQAVGKQRKLGEKFIAIKQEGRTSNWEADQTQAAVKATLEELEPIITDMQKTATKARLEALEAERQSRKSSGSDAALHLQKATAILQGKTPEQALASFERAMLDPENREYRYHYETILEDSILTHYPDTHIQMQAVLQKYQTPEQLEAAKDAQRAEVMTAHDQTLRGLITESVRAIARNEEPTNYDWAALFNEMVDNASEQVDAPKVEV